MQPNQKMCCPHCIHDCKECTGIGVCTRIWCKNTSCPCHVLEKVDQQVGGALRRLGGMEPQEWEEKLPNLLANAQHSDPHLEKALSIFIRSLLSTQRAEMVGEVEEAMELKPHSDWERGYHKCLSDLIAHLRGKEML